MDKVAVIGDAIDIQERIVREAGNGKGADFARGHLSGLRQARDIAAMETPQPIAVEQLKAFPAYTLWEALLSSQEELASEWARENGCKVGYSLIRDGAPEVHLAGELMPHDLILSVIHPNGTDRGLWDVDAKRNMRRLR